MMCLRWILLIIMRERVFMSFIISKLQHALSDMSLETIFVALFYPIRWNKQCVHCAY